MEQIPLLKKKVTLGNDRYDMNTIFGITDTVPCWGDTFGKYNFENS